MKLELELTEQELDVLLHRLGIIKRDRILSFLDKKNKPGYNMYLERLKWKIQKARVK